MKLYNVTNISGLFNVLDSLQSDVTLRTADGACFDWQTQKDIIRSMSASLSVPQFRELSLIFTDHQDAGSVLSFLMECRRTDKGFRNAA